MKRAFILLAVLLVVFGGYWWYRSWSRSAEEAYIGERRVTLWSSTAQVRQPLVTLHFGEKIAVLGHYGDRLQVRTWQGATGWIDAGQVIDWALWHQVLALAARTSQMKIQGRGHTRVLSNLRLEPGRSAPRIAQLPPEVPVDLLARATAEAPASDEGEQQGEEGSPLRSEDWLLVRTQVPEVGEIAGWALGRFIQYDLPDPLPAYASAAGMRVLGWFELNRVPDPRLGPKPQYLVVGSSGPEGQSCDFTILRVFTWAKKRQRYETAYKESNLCGRLPVQVKRPEGKGDVYFRFGVLGKNGEEEFAYRMRQTIVRRVRPEARLAGHRR